MNTSERVMKYFKGHSFNPEWNSSCSRSQTINNFTMTLLDNNSHRSTKFFKFTQLIKRLRLRNKDCATKHLHVLIFLSFWINSKNLNIFYFLSANTSILDIVNQKDNFIFTVYSKVLAGQPSFQRGVALLVVLRFELKEIRKGNRIFFFQVQRICRLSI